MFCPECGKTNEEDSKFCQKKSTFFSQTQLSRPKCRGVVQLA